MNSETFVISAISGIAASLVGVPLGHLLAERRHVTQQWWDLKAQAYSDVLLGLSRLSSAVQDLYKELADEQDEADKDLVTRAQQLWERSAQDLEEIGNQGSFKISAYSEEILQRINVAIGRPVQEEKEIAKWLLSTILELRVATRAMSIEAKRDLGVGGMRGAIEGLVGEAGSRRRESLPWPLGHRVWIGRGRQSLRSDGASDGPARSPSHESTER